MAQRSNRGVQEPRSWQNVRLRGVEGNYTANGILGTAVQPAGAPAMPPDGPLQLLVMRHLPRRLSEVFLTVTSDASVAAVRLGRRFEAIDLITNVSRGHLARASACGANACEISCWTSGRSRSF